MCHVSCISHTSSYKFWTKSEIKSYFKTKWALYNISNNNNRDFISTLKSISVCFQGRNQLNTKPLTAINKTWHYTQFMRMCYPLITGRYNVMSIDDRIMMSTVMSQCTQYLPQIKLRTSHVSSTISRWYSVMITDLFP